MSVRQSSLFFHPHYMSDNEQGAESLLTYRRDAVAAVLMNLYVLAGALRGGQKVPVRLPDHLHLFSPCTQLTILILVTALSPFRSFNPQAPPRAHGPSRILQHLLPPPTLLLPLNHSPQNHNNRKRKQEVVTDLQLFV